MPQMPQLAGMSHFGGFMHRQQVARHDVGGCRRFGRDRFCDSWHFNRKRQAACGATQFPSTLDDPMLPGHNTSDALWQRVAEKPHQEFSGPLKNEIEG